MKNPTINDEVLFDIDLIADLPIGDIISNNAIICIQLNGICTCSLSDINISVYGNNKNIVNAINDAKKSIKNSPQTKRTNQLFNAISQKSKLQLELLEKNISGKKVELTQEYKNSMEAATEKFKEFASKLNFLKKKVTIDSENQQTPQYGRMTSQEGEFVFVYSEHTIINQNVGNTSTDAKLDLLLSEIEELKSQKSSGDDIVVEKAVDVNSSWFEKYGFETTL